jgi:hypothetical protein
VKEEAPVPYPFLSDEWLDEVQKLTAEAGDGLLPSALELNLVVTGTPSGDKELHVSSGAFAQGLIDGCPTKLTIPYTVAKSMFVDGNQAAAMQAFMGGQIRVEGDMSRLMAMQGQMSAGPSAAADAMQAKLREITSDA